MYSYYLFYLIVAFCLITAYKKYGLKTLGLTCGIAFLILVGQELFYKLQISKYLTSDNLIVLGILVLGLIIGLALWGKKDTKNKD